VKKELRPFHDPVSCDICGRTILKGERAGHLPIEQPAIFDVVVNLRTAKTLGIAIPETVLVGADEVIE